MLFGVTFILNESGVVNEHCYENSHLDENSAIKVAMIAVGVFRHCSNGTNISNFSMEFRQ